MNGKNMKEVLRFFRKNSIIELYSDIFDRTFDFNKIVLISDKEALKIINSNKIESVIRIYEIFNNVCINEYIKEIVYKEDNFEKIKYILRLAVSNSFDDDETRLKYIGEILKIEDEKTIKYAYAVSNDKRVNSNEFGVMFVGIVGNAKVEISRYIRDLLLQEGFIDKKDSFEFIKTLSYASEEYIAEHMISLYNSYKKDEKVPVEYLSVLLSAKGEKQVEYAYNILKNSEIMKRKDGLFIALSIATREEGYQAEKGFNTLMNKNILENEDASELIFEIITKDIQDDNLDLECEIKEILQTKNIDEIIRSLLSVRDDEEITLNTKVKTKSLK